MVELESTCGTLFSNLLMKRICNTLREDRISSFRTKNNKISRLIIDKVVHTERMKWAPQTKNLKYKVPKKSCSLQDDLNKQPVPVINLSRIELSKDEEGILSYGLDHSFIDKNQYVKSYLAASLETVTDRLTSLVDNEKKEDLHSICEQTLTL